MQLFNTATRQKDQFKPIHDKSVGIYTCGPTVYDVAHIGNLRAFVFADTMVRALKFLGYKVKWVLNITDIDDKTIAGAAKVEESLKEFTRKYEKKFFEDLAALNVSKQDVNPRATEHFKQMLEIVRELEVRKLGYATKDGIYFDISKFSDYGKLAGLEKRALKPGARVDVDSYDKKSPGDFALWKFNSQFTIHNSQFKGRPGWHIECSAMSRAYLGQPFDIHTGGVDLIFPHHENEIAQSQGAYGKPLANYFVHNEHLLVDDKKMAKSEGNYITLDAVREKGLDPLALRYLFLQSHYREKMNFTWDSLAAAARALSGVREVVQRGFNNSQTRQLANKIIKTISDDLNTPEALGLLHKANDANLWLEFERVLGLNLSGLAAEVSPQQQRLIDQREKLRRDGKFVQADKIRKDLEKQGIVIEDTPSGPRVLGYT